MTSLSVGQSLGVGGGAQEGQGAHSWAVIEETGGSWRLVHFPPRGFGNGAASAGQIRPASVLESPPTAMAAHGPTVYLLYQDPLGEPSEGTEETPSVRVYSVRAEQVMSGYWVYKPDGRFASHPSLSTQHRVLGASSDADGRLIVLLAGDGDQSELHRLEDDRWVQVPVSGLRSNSETDRFTSNGESPLVFAGKANPQVSVWNSHDESFEPSELRVAHPDSLHSVHFFGPRVVYTVMQGSSLEVWMSLGDTRLLLRTLEQTTNELCVVPIRVGGGRLVILERIESPETTAEYRLTEISLSTGEVLHRGPPARVSPVSTTEFRMLAASLVLFMVVVVVITFRPAMDPSAIVIPPGTALCDPGRRVVASGLDFLLVAIVVSKIFEVEFSSLVTGVVFFEPGDGWVALPATLVLGTVMGSVCECLFAWSPGKLVMGCRVIRLGTEPRRVSLARSVQRNVVKWITPPIAAMAMLDPNHRHRGDDLARAAVVVRVDPGPEED